MTMVLVLALALVGEPQAERPPIEELAIPSRDRATLVLIAAKGEGAPKSSASDVIAALASALKRRTDLFLLPNASIGAEDYALGRCDRKRLLTCWLRAVEAERASVLFIVSAFSDPSGDRASIVAVPVDDAVKIDRAADPKITGWEDAVENEIFAKSARASLAWSAAHDQNAIREEIERAIGSDLSPVLEKHAPLSSAIEIETDAGAELGIDGAAIGRTPSGKVRIVDVRPGVHVVSLKNPSDGRRIERSVALEPNAISKVDAMFVREPGVPWNKVVFLSGASVAALGTAFAIYASLAHRPELFEACVEPGCDANRRFASVCEVTRMSASCLRGSKGVLAAPLGYSVAIAGAIWASGALFEGREGDDETFPWLSVALGAAAFVLAYGMSALFDDAKPRAQ